MTALSPSVRLKELLGRFRAALLAWKNPEYMLELERFRAALEEMHNTRASAFYDRESDFRRIIRAALRPNDR